MSERGKRVASTIVAVSLGAGLWLWGRAAGRNEAALVADAQRQSRALVPGEQLDPTVRALLRGRMGRHADTAARLWDAVLAVDYGAIVQHAKALAEEPRLSRPAANEDPSLLNAVIPDTFFSYQEALARRTDELTRAAQARDAAAVTTAFQGLVATCVACHAHYRDGAPSRLAP